MAAGTKGEKEKRYPVAVVAGRVVFAADIFISRNKCFVEKSAFECVGWKVNCECSEIGREQGSGGELSAG